MPQPWKLLLHISLKIFGEPDRPIRIYAHLWNKVRDVWQNWRGAKMMRILNRSGFAAGFFKNRLSTHVIVAASQMGTLTSCWEIIEITCFRRRSVERFGERAASHDFFGAKLIFEETCASRAGRPPFDVWLPYKCDRRQELHISIRTSPDCSEVGW